MKGKKKKKKKTNLSQLTASEPHGEPPAPLWLPGTQDSEIHELAEQDTASGAELEHDLDWEMEMKMKKKVLKKREEKFKRVSLFFFLFVVVVSQRTEYKSPKAQNQLSHVHGPSQARRRDLREEEWDRLVGEADRDTDLFFFFFFFFFFYRFF